MPITVTEQLVLKSDNDETILTMYLNNAGEMYISEGEDDTPCSFFCAISKNDWQEIKLFIDKQFELCNQ